MILTCEYCGAELETEIDDVCPRCGATFENNREYLKKKARAEEAEQLDMEQKKIDLEKQKQANIAGQVIELRTEILRNTTPNRMSPFYFDEMGKLVGKIIAIIAILIFLIGMGSSCMADNDSDSSSDNAAGYSNSNSDSLNYAVSVDKDDYKTTTTDTATTVKYRAQATMSKYTVMCDNVLEVTCPPAKPASGNRFASFHFVIKNTTDEMIYTESAPSCTADGMFCTPVTDKIRETIPSSINAGDTATFNACFEVPEDADNFKIQYGYVTIEIESPLK